MRFLPVVILHRMDSPFCGSYTNVPPDSRIFYNESAPSRKPLRHGILAIVSDILHLSFSLGDTVRKG